MNTSVAGLSPRTLPHPHDTIVALSSAPGPGARAIVRLSGAGCRTVIATCFRPASADSVIAFPGRTGGTIDCAGGPNRLSAEVLTWAAPHSYTGQDLVEIHTLACGPLVDALIAALLRLGARAAQPGEFTLRAFLAGKLDLTQAEAVLGVLAAANQDELQSALVQLAGGMARPLHQLRDELLALLAEVEAGLDFAEEDLTFIAGADLCRRLRLVRQTLERLRDQLAERAVSDRPFRVVLAGPPNAGKSSLFNALVGDALALVSPEAGTTRDFLIGRVTWDNVEIELIDTAGHELDEGPAEPITHQAQEARREQLRRADLVVSCRDASTASEPRQGAGAPPMLAIATKCDLHTPEPGLLATSTIKPLGLSELRGELVARARQARRPAALAPSWSRCRNLLASALEHIGRAEVLANDSRYPELLALELRAALDPLGEMVGAVYTDDLLDRIFSQFCIGK